jgi:DNA (cytosine-5)-methyltransferase 1
MTHLGDICKINGAEADPVDVIIGGSPCQDLSVAGKRAGLDGERSGLFMEQIRIIKEMRNADKLRIERLSDTKIRGRSGTDNTSGKGGVCGDIRNTNASSTDCGEGGTTTVESGITQHGFCGTSQFIRPRYMVWENVPGAFSSNKGEDFRIVLEETAKIADETAVIPRPDKGKWTNAGAIMGDGWSIAWRVFDAQFWGVPQRRRRIALVADFGGQSAPEILFEREGVRGDIAESGAERERVAGDVEVGAGTAIGFDSYN